MCSLAVLGSTTLRLLLLLLACLTLIFGLAIPVVAQVPATSLESQCARFDVAQNASLQLKWQLLSPGVGGPYTRISHTAVALPSPSRVLIIGGIACESAQPVVVNTTIVYDPATDLFSLPVDQIASSATPVTAATKGDVFVSPASRVDHASALVSGSSSASSSWSSSVVVLFGGQNKEFLNDAWRLCLSADSTQSKWDQFVIPPSDAVSLAAAPSARIGHSLSVIYENTTFTGLLVYGGLSESYVEVGGQLNLALFARSSLQGTCGDRSPRVHWRTLRVTTGTTQPPVRAYHSASPVSKLFVPQRSVCVVLYGGKSLQANTIYGDVWRLCPVATASGGSVPVAIESQEYQWELLNPLGSRGPGPRYGAAIAMIDEGKIAIAGGSYTFPNDFLSDLWELNVNATQWLSLRFDADFTPPRRGHAIALVGSDRLFLFGGRDRYSVVTQRMQVTTYAAPYCVTGLKITLCEATSQYVCVPCPAGYFLEAGTRNCLACSAGTYSSEGVATCTKCPTGTYNPLTAQTTLSACVACPVGSYSNVEGAPLASSCWSCAAGTFASSSGTSACANCVAGSFSLANATVCTPCNIGEWSPLAAAQCSKCAAGSYNPRTGSANCYPCPKGFYTDAGAAVCVACPINTYSAVVSTAGASGCVACPPLMFTSDSGQSSCQYCAPGMALASGFGCQPCAKGVFSGGASTNGACVACPLHTYASAVGSSQCVACPTGTLSTTTGTTSPTDCTVCASSMGQYFDGVSCRACSPGKFISSDRVVPYCEACAPGTYTSTSAEASLSTGCQSCQTMAVAATAGASTCVACADNSFAMAAWRTCISCAPSFASECPLGRNGAVCSGNGVCVLRGCECASGWAGGDCSSPINVASVASGSSGAAAAVLHFAVNQTRAIRTWPSTLAASATFEIRVKRAGSVSTELQARIQVKTSTSNATTVPASIFPASVTMASGASEATLTFAVSAFTSTALGSNCRTLTLELVDLAGVPASLSVVAADSSDRTLTLYFDPMNGPNGGSSSSSTTTRTVSYSIDLSSSSSLPSAVTASAALDRVTSTKLKLSPPPSATSPFNAMTLNFRVVLDPQVAESIQIADLVPAWIAKIQAAYTDSSVRVGLLRSSTTSATIYSSLPSFFTAVKQATTIPTTSPPVASLTWQVLADRLTATNATQWALEDRTLRRFLVAFLNPDAVYDDIAVFATALRQSASFAWVVFPPGRTYASSPALALASDVIQIVTLSSSTSELPQKLVDALQARDRTAVAASSTFVVSDPGSVVVASGSSPSVLIPSLGWPALELLLNPLAFSLTTTTVVVAVAGYFMATVSLVEPGASCSAVTPPESLLPLDENVLSGWVGAWHLLSDPLWTRQWIKSPADDAHFSLQRYNDSSFLRTARTSVVAMRAVGATRSVALTRSFAGNLVATGLDLVVKGFVRHAFDTTAPTGGVACALGLVLTRSDSANHTTVDVQHVVTTRAEWSYIHFSTAVPFEVATMQLRMSCNTTLAIHTVEWTSLGLFPDPQIACLCPRGFFYDAGVCVRCPAGSYCVAGIKKQCTLGYFSFGKADHCERCRDGWICVDGLVRLCEPGTFASPESACVICPSGYSCRNGKKTICPVGTFSFAQASDCQLCPPGTISTAEGSSSCSLCSLGSTSNYKRDHCVSCAAGEATLWPGQHACASCVATVFSSRALLEVCTSP